MQPINRSSVKKIKKYLEELKKNPPKPHHEIDLHQVGKLMNGIRFIGPTAKHGSSRGFAHELLARNPMLVEGRITIHVIHGSETVSYRDFKQRLLPFIQEVLDSLEDQNLIQEDKPDVPI
jgi:hypothetical protein